MNRKQSLPRFPFSNEEAVKWVSLPLKFRYWQEAREKQLARERALFKIKFR